jgi:hypothetical protein
MKKEKKERKKEEKKRNKERNKVKQYMKQKVDQRYINKILSSTAYMIKWYEWLLYCHCWSKTMSSSRIRLAESHGSNTLPPAESGFKMQSEVSEVTSHSQPQKETKKREAKKKKKEKKKKSDFVPMSLASRVFLGSCAFSELSESVMRSVGRLKVSKTVGFKCLKSEQKQEKCVLIKQQNKQTKNPN